MSNACTPIGYTSTPGTVRVSQLSHQILGVANQLLTLPRFGSEVEPMSGLQGGWRPWTSYSGPTHRQDALDVTAYNWKNRVTVLDLLGMVAFHRTRAQGNWAPHIHMIPDGLSCVDPYAQGQIESAKRGRDGLKANGPDPDANLRSGLWPLAVYGGMTGKLTAIKGTHLYDGPAGSRTVVRDAPKGTTVSAIMEVRNNHGNRWFVTDQGLWGYTGKWVL